MRLEQVRYQLTYTNLFEQVPYWTTPEDTTKIIPSFGFIAAGLEGAKVRDFNSTTIFHIAEDLALSVGIRNGQNNMTARRVLVIELDATGAQPYFEANAANGWYERAHAAITKSFVELTDPSIQKQYWIPK